MNNVRDAAQHAGMRGGWFGRIFRGGAERIQALEREVDAIHTAVATVAHQVPLEAERAQQMARALNELKGQLCSLESRASIDRDLLRSATEDVRNLEERAKADRDDLVKMRTALLRVQRELDHSVEQAREAATGLFRRIESVRLAQIKSGVPTAPGKSET
jgi:predicted  nucleic acid-binding Zn-ribbon protein